MEKIDPFVPTQDKNVPLIFKITNITIALMKIPLFFLLLVLSTAYSAISMIMPFSTIRNLVSRMCSLVIVRFQLFMLGVFYAPIKPTPLIDNFKDFEEQSSPQSGDVIISNCSSILNILWIQCKYSPIYVIPIDAKKVVVKHCLQVIGDILLKRPIDTGKTTTLSRAIEFAKTKLKCPIVLFPEGAVTNGSCIIRFRSFGEDINPETVRFFIYGFTYPKYLHNPNFVQGNSIVHLFKLLGSIIVEVNIRTALQQDIPKSKNGKIDQEWIDRVQHIMSSITRLPYVDVNSYDSPVYLNFQSSKLHSQ